MPPARRLLKLYKLPKFDGSRLTQWRLHNQTIPIEHNFGPGKWHGTRNRVAGRTVPVSLKPTGEFPYEQEQPRQPPPQPG